MSNKHIIVFVVVYLITFDEQKHHALQGEMHKRTNYSHDMKKKPLSWVEQFEAKGWKVKYTKNTSKLTTKPGYMKLLNQVKRINVTREKQRLTIERQNKTILRQQSVIDEQEKEIEHKWKKIWIYKKLVRSLNEKVNISLNVNCNVSQLHDNTSISLSNETSKLGSRERAVFDVAKQ